MTLIFFDEVKQQPDYPFYHIGGVCIQEEILGEVELQINNISKKIFGNSRLGRDTEFHAVDVFHRKKNFQKIESFKERLDILEEFFRILSREEIGRIDIQINTSKLYSTQNAERIAFMYFCERCESYLRQKKQVGILIGDRESDHIAEKSSIALSEYREKGTQFEYGLQIEKLFESVHFTHSHLSRFLQLADFYCWKLQFVNRNRNSDKLYHQSVFNLFKGEGINMFPSRYKTWPL